MERKTKDKLRDLFIQADEEDEDTQDMYIYKYLSVIARKTVNKGEVCVIKRNLKS